MNKKVALLAFVLVLLSTALSLCVVGLLELQRAYASPYTNIDVHTAYDMITGDLYPDLVVLDVRTQSEYDSGHIYGAVWIPVTELEARIAELAGHENHEIIVYCGSGVRSVTASGILDSHNFTKVYNMLGGISAWQSAGYPVWIATVHNVDTTFDYDTIQAAIDAPQTLDGHTILVDAGIYYENVVVNKTVALIGENKDTTVIDGSEEGIVVTITTNSVNVSEFKIRNGWFGILLDGSNSCTVTSNNIVSHEGYGIKLSSSSGNNVSGNMILNNGYGIYLHDSGNNTFIYNNMTGNSYNFEVWGDSLSHFIQDIDTSNTVDGKPIYYWINQHNKQSPVDAGYVAIVNSTNVTIKDLSLRNNGQGVLFVHTTNSTIENVNASNTYRAIHLYNCDNNTIIGNTLSNNMYGIDLLNCSNNTFTRNNISDNTNYGIYLHDNSSNNTIYNNLFTFNIVRNVFDNGSANIWNVTKTLGINIVNGPYFGGNYYSDYTGVDNDGDDIGDSPHVIPGTAGSVDYLPLIRPGIHDIAVTNVTLTPNKTIVGQGLTLKINVTIANEGNVTEDIHSLNIYANLTIIRSQIVKSLAPGTSTTLRLTLNVPDDLPKGNYTIKAESMVPGEIDKTDNNYTDGTIRVNMAGDVAPEFGIVDIVDIVYVAIHFGAEKGEPEYEANADINDDGSIDIVDIVIVAIHFGELCVTVHVQYEDGTPISDVAVEIFESETSAKVADGLTDGDGNFVPILKSPAEHYGYVYGPSTKDIPPFTPTKDLIITIEYPNP